MIAILAESPLSPERPTQTACRGRRRPDVGTRGKGGRVEGGTSRHPSDERETGIAGLFRTEKVGFTALRAIRTEEETNRGEARARPDDVKGVIPGAVDVAD